MVATVDFVNTRDFEADPATVFDYLSNPLNDPDWCPLVNGCEQVSGDGPGVGSVYVWDQVIGEEQTAPMEFTIDTFDRPNRLEWSLDNEMMGYRSTITFEPRDGGGTRVTQHNRTLVKAAPDEMGIDLTDQALSVNNQQMDNLELIL